MTQPKALFLADVIEADPASKSHHDEAAAELRRLHAENEAQQGAIAQFHHAVAGAGWHPGRTDDLLTDIIRDKGQELRRLHAQRDALLAALKKAVENGCATVYANEDDECGERGCCGVVSYKPHADDCWVTTARAAIKAVEEEA